MNTKHSIGNYWWIILVAVITLLLPILLNFFVFKPVSQLSVGRLQDWMAFWGSYLSATISAMVAFAILSIQRKDAKQNYEQIRKDNRSQYLFDKRVTGLNEAIKNDKENNLNRQLQMNQLMYQKEVQWLNELRKTLVKYISAYQENEIKGIINGIQGFSFESVQLTIKVVLDTLAQADTALCLIISENSNTAIGDTYQKKLAKLYTQYKSIIDDIQLLVCLYYNKSPMSDKTSNNLNNLIVTIGIDPKKIDYNQFSELAHQIIIPLSGIFETVRTLCQSYIKDERKRIDSILNDNIKNPGF